MSWRTTQLGQDLCDQDRLILNLFKNTDLKYIGSDHEFKRVIPHDDHSSNLVLVINYEVWCSDITKLIRKYLCSPIDRFYIGINRYYIKGNDTTEKFKSTNNHGQDIVAMLATMTERVGYKVTKSGFYDKDMGRHFNFVQPLTWIYGHKVETDTGN